MTSPSAARADGEAFEDRRAVPNQPFSSLVEADDARRVVTALLEALREAEQECTALQADNNEWLLY